MSTYNKLTDCNYCIYLNISEYEQRIRLANGEYPPNHRCRKYDERLLHLWKNGQHTSCIIPCDRCLSEMAAGGGSTKLQNKYNGEYKNERSYNS